MRSQIKKIKRTNLSRKICSKRLEKNFPALHEKANISLLHIKAQNPLNPMLKQFVRLKTFPDNRAVSNLHRLFRHLHKKAHHSGQ
jgi:hypothetical protein